MGPRFAASPATSLDSSLPALTVAPRGASAPGRRVTVSPPLKLGGLATHQARRAARAIARYAGVEAAPTDDDGELVLDGVLMTGAAPVALDDRPLEPAAARPLWWPSRKVAGRYLHAYLEDEARSAAQPRPQAGVRVRLDAATARELDTGYLYSPSRFPSAEEIARLGRRIHDYKRDHR